MRGMETPVIETIIVAVKFTGVVFLAEVALLPGGHFEEPLLRLGAAALAGGAVWRMWVRPVVTWIHRSVDIFLGEHHEAVEGLREMRTDVSDMKDDLSEIKKRLATVEHEEDIRK